MSWPVSPPFFIDARTAALYTSLLFIDHNAISFWSSGLRNYSPYYAILQAATARQGIELFQEKRFDCLVLELGVPQSGFDVLRFVVSQGQSPAVPIVVLTSLNNPVLQKRAIDEGAQLYLVKQRTTAKVLHETIQGAIKDFKRQVNVTKRDGKKIELTDSLSIRTKVASAERIRVLIVDDQAMVRQELRSVLCSYSNIAIVGEAGDGELAIRMVARLKPAVVIMDLNVPKLDAIAATRLIKANYPHICVIGLSVTTHSYSDYTMRKSGAFEVLPKENAVHDLYPCIQRGIASVEPPMIPERKPLMSEHGAFPLDGLDRPENCEESNN
jgi:DNA-binding NarL/FixJ family response regulator